MDRDDLADLVDKLIGSEITLEGLSISEGSTLVGIPDAGSRIGADLGQTTSPTASWSRGAERNLYITELDKPAKEPIIVHGSDLFIAMPNPRIDGKAYSKTLKTLLDRVQNTDPILVRPARRTDFDRASLDSPLTLSTSETPLTDVELVSARKTIIPILVALDCQDEEDIDKSVIADSLHRSIALWPDGNPPRAALKRVNEVLMSGNRVIP